MVLALVVTIFTHPLQLLGELLQVVVALALIALVIKGCSTM